MIENKGIYTNKTCQVFQMKVMIFLLVLYIRYMLSIFQSQKAIYTTTIHVFDVSWYDG